MWPEQVSDARLVLPFLSCIGASSFSPLSALGRRIINRYVYRKKLRQKKENQLIMVLLRCFTLRNTCKWLWNLHDGRKITCWHSLCFYYLSTCQSALGGEILVKISSCSQRTLKRIRIYRSWVVIENIKIKTFFSLGAKECLFSGKF